MDSSRYSTRIKIMGNCGCENPKYSGGWCFGMWSGLGCHNKSRWYHDEKRNIIVIEDGVKRLYETWQFGSYFAKCRAYCDRCKKKNENDTHTFNFDTCTLLCEDCVNEERKFVAFKEKGKIVVVEDNGIIQEITDASNVKINEFKEKGYWRDSKNDGDVRNFLGKREGAPPCPLCGEKVFQHEFVIHIRGFHEDELNKLGYLDRWDIRMTAYHEGMHEHFQEVFLRRT
jgi:hypothetical protein